MELETREVGQVTDAIICPHCGATVLPPEDPDVSEEWNPALACPHTWGLWHDHGIAYLSPEARGQLAASGIIVNDDPDLGIDLEVPGNPESEDDRSLMDILTSTIHGPGAVVLAVYTGPPGFEGSYVGVTEGLS